MSISCTICGEFRGHNQETHNDHYEELLMDLLERVKKLESQTKEPVGSEEEL